MLQHLPMHSQKGRQLSGCCWWIPGRQLQTSRRAESWRLEDSSAPAVFCSADKAQDENDRRFLPHQCTQPGYMHRSPIAGEHWLVRLGCQSPGRPPASLASWSWGWLHSHTPHRPGHTRVCWGLARPAQTQVCFQNLEQGNHRVPAHGIP